MRFRKVATAGAMLLVIAGSASCATDDDAVDPPAPTSTAALDSVSSAAADLDGAIDVGGRERTYHVHLPPGLGAEPVPLLVALHGGLGSGEQFRTNSGFDEVADANGFIVVYPDGIGGVMGNDDLRTWNAGYCCGPAQREQVDDVVFLSQLLDALEGTYPIDASRVFAAGHSNGGMMAYRLACELSDEVAAIAVYGASLGLPSCEPTRPVSLLHVHGTADENHPIDGGPGDKSFTDIDYAPARDGVEAIAAADGCDDPVSVETGDLATTTWSGCRAGTEVVFVAISGASHAWPGGEGGNERLVGPTYQGYATSAEMWAFFTSLPARG